MNILLRARDELRSPERWARFNMGVTNLTDPDEVDDDNPEGYVGIYHGMFGPMPEEGNYAEVMLRLKTQDIRCMCSRGAILRSAETEAEAVDTEIALAKVLRPMTDERFAPCTIESWNDNCDRTHAEVIAMFEKAAGVPTVEEMEAIRLVDGKACGCTNGVWTPIDQHPNTMCECDECFTFQNGNHSAICTNHADLIVAMYPEISYRTGFEVGNNPVTNSNIYACGGHDFAVIANRYIVDHWIRDVCGEPRQVFDLWNPDDAALIAERYGDPQKWDHPPR